ncbi:MAG: hypothetical protein ABW321_11905 [Polyangiales bacterium]
MNAPLGTALARQLSLGLVLMCGATACHPEPLFFQTGRVPIETSPTHRERLTLEEMWEVPLETCCQGGPYAPEEVKASCFPAERCRAVAQYSGPPGDRPHPIMRLDVIALSPGPVDVVLWYRQPDYDEWLTARAYLEFVPTPAEQTLKLGARRPTGPFKLEASSDMLREWGVGTPARCEVPPRPGYDEHALVQDYVADEYTCFGPENVDGQIRYPSCHHSRRCNASLQWGRFLIDLDRSMKDGTVTRVHMHADAYGTYDDVGTWE